MKYTLRIATFSLFALTAAAIFHAANEDASGELAALKEALDRPLFAKSERGEISSVLGKVERNRHVPPPELSADSFIISDINDGTVYFEGNSSAARPIASITKLLSAAVVIDTVPLEELVTISPKALEGDGDSGFTAGERVRADVLLSAGLLESSNDAILALAEHAGSILDPESLDPVAVFVNTMNKKAVALGMVSSHFTDPAGLEDEHSESSAEDVSRLLSALRKDQIYIVLWDILASREIAGETEEGHPLRTFVNNNPFLSERAGIIGGKTGYTDLAGESMTLVAHRPDGQGEIVYVVLGSEDRFRDLRTLLNWVSSAYVWEKLHSK
jgi:D-alanyl-D-alanine carboxypeptidase